MTTGTTNPWSSAPRSTEHHNEAPPDMEMFIDYAAATNTYAGPFCACGDYSCPANDNPSARCVNSEDPSGYIGRYPESWTDEDIDAYEAQELLDSLISEAQELLDSLISEAHYEAHDDTLRAVERINTLGAEHGANSSHATHSHPRHPLTCPR